MSGKFQRSSAPPAPHPARARSAALQPPTPVPQPRILHAALLLAQVLLILIAGAAGQAAASAAAQTGATGQVEIHISQPAPGAVITGSEVLVQLATTGVVALPAAGVAQWPEAGLFHIFLDGTDVLQTPLVQFSLQPVTPGPHRLRVELQDWPAGQAAPAEAAFTVVPAPPQPGASWWMAGTVAAVVAVLFSALLLLWLFWVRPVQVSPVYDAAAEDDVKRET
jgi:hypothetical protein